VLNAITGQTLIALDYPDNSVQFSSISTDSLSILFGLHGDIPGNLNNKFEVVNTAGTYLFGLEMTETDQVN